MRGPLALAAVGWSAVPSMSPSTESGQVFRGDAELPVGPAFADLLDQGIGELDGEALGAQRRELHSEQAPRLDRVQAGDRGEHVGERAVRVLVRRAGLLLELRVVELGELADAVAGVHGRLHAAQPLDVVRGVAPRAAGRAQRGDDAVAAFPGAQHVRRDAGQAGSGAERVGVSRVLGRGIGHVQILGVGSPFVEIFRGLVEGVAMQVSR